MAQGQYKIGEVIEVTYQATKSTTGLVDVTMEIYDETHTKDVITFPDIIMTEIGTTGRYYGSFTPDVEGVWNVTINSVTKKGEVVKQYAVVGYNIDAVGDAINVVDGKVDSIDVKVDALESPPMIG
jgi:hypothetical protein